jgi:hypothetical protein
MATVEFSLRPSQDIWAQSGGNDFQNLPSFFLNLHWAQPHNIITS